MKTNQSFVVNSNNSMLAFVRNAEILVKKHGYVTFGWRIGESRSLPQNALLHLWLTEYAAHLLNKLPKQVLRGELEGMKRHAKLTFNAEFKRGWMIHDVVNPKNPMQRKKDVTSSSTWKRGEMFEFLTWLQMKAAHDGLVLESKGEYAELQRKHNGE